MKQASPSLESASRRLWDVVVIGAGPAGAMAAYQLAQADADVLLIDRKCFPRSKVCGGCLHGEAVGLLRAAGLESRLETTGWRPLQTFRLHAAGRSARFPWLEGRAVSRRSLDEAFLDACRQTGVAFLPGTRAILGDVQGESREVFLQAEGRQRVVRSRVVLDASGLAGGCLENRASRRSRVWKRSRIGAGCLIDPPSGRCEPGTIDMGVARGGYIGLVRVEDDRLNVAAALDPTFLRECGSLATAGGRLLEEAGLPPIHALKTADWQATPWLTRRRRSPAAERLFVLGDAAGYVEPFTGEGIAWALATGEAVVPLALQGLQQWSLRLQRQWSSRYRSLVARRQWLCRGVAELLRHPRLVAEGTKWLARKPSMARPILQFFNRPRVSSEARSP